MLTGMSQVINWANGRLGRMGPFGAIISAATIAARRLGSHPGFYPGSYSCPRISSFITAMLPGFIFDADFRSLARDEVDITRYLETGCYLVPETGRPGFHEAPLINTAKANPSNATYNRNANCDCTCSAHADADSSAANAAAHCAAAIAEAIYWRTERGRSPSFPTPSSLQFPYGKKKKNIGVKSIQGRKGYGLGHTSPEVGMQAGPVDGLVDPPCRGVGLSRQISTRRIVFEESGHAYP